MEFKEGERISWTRPYGKEMSPVTSHGEVIRNIKKKKPGTDKLMVILDEKLYPSTVLVSQVTKAVK